MLVNQQRQITDVVQQRLGAFLKVNGAEIDQLSSKRRADSVESVVTDIKKTFGLINVAVGGVWSNKHMARVSGYAATQAEQHTSTAIKSQIHAMSGVNPLLSSGAVRERIQDFARENVGLIKDTNKHLLTKLEQETIQAVVSGRTVRDFSEVVRKRLGKGRRRAAFIARDQIGSLNGWITETRHGELGVEGFIFLTTGDERVRPSHRELDRHVFTWADAPIKPGREYNCRCTAYPVLSWVGLPSWAIRSRR